MSSELEKCHALIQDLAGALTEAVEHISGEVDVVDGDYGVPAPNRDMQLTTQWESILERAKP